MASSKAPMQSVRQGANMQMHQIRYFLALCEERSFTLAARRSGVSQPSLTNAISALERELGGALFQRRPVIALTALGQAMQPYLKQIAQAADQAREAAQALADVDPAMSDVPTPDHPARSPQCSSG
jgi:DNA-binding transcriptional LysR family regulator